MLDLRKQNAYLKMEVDKLRRQLEVREDYFIKYRDNKNQLKELQDVHKKNEVQ